MNIYPTFKPIHTNMKNLATLLFLGLLSLQAQASLTVFSAASTTDAMKELALNYTKESAEQVLFNFASSGALARQIEAGAPADCFISANVRWMDWLEEKAVIQPDSRFNLAANTLVLVAPAGSSLTFDGSISGKIAVGDFKSVPAGMYAKEALTHLGWLDKMRPNLVMASNVRTALLYVERGEVSAGIVYFTDAKASGKLSVIGTFPAESHRPIIYPAALCSNNKNAEGFMRFLKTPKAQAILTKHGFTTPRTKQ